MAYAVQTLMRDELETKASRTAPLLAEYHGTRAQDQPDPYSDYRELYTLVGWVYRCITNIADAGSAIPLDVVRRVPDREAPKGFGEEAAFDTELAGLLEFINPRWTSPDFIAATAIDLNLSGNAYWSIEYGPTKKLPAELWRLSPDRVKILPSATDYIGGYEYSVSRDHVITFEAEEVLHVRYLNPNDDYYGVGPLKAAITPGVIECYGAQYNRAVLRRGGWPMVKLKTDQGEISPAHEAQFKRAWQEKFSGPSNAAKVIMLPSGLEMEPVGLTPDQLQWTQSRKMTREEIGAIFGVPPIMMSLYEGVNYATAEQQEKQFYTIAALPTLNKIAAAINEFLAPQFETSLRVRFDTSGIACLQEDKHKEAERVANLVTNRIITPNEGRRILGMEGEVPGGDEVLAPVALLPVGETREEEPADEAEEKLFALGADVGDGNGRREAVGV